MPGLGLVGAAGPRGASEELQEIIKQKFLDALKIRAAELEEQKVAQQESQFGRSLTQRGSEFERTAGQEDTKIGNQASQFGQSLAQRGSEFDRSYGLLKNRDTREDTEFQNKQGDYNTMKDIIRTLPKTMADTIQVKLGGGGDVELRTPEQKGLEAGQEAGALYGPGGGLKRFTEMQGILNANALKLKTAGDAVTPEQKQQLDRMAEMYIQDPDAFDKINPTLRGQILGHIAGSGREFQSRAKQTAVDGLLAAQQSLNDIKALPGFEAAVGMKGASSLFGVIDPLPGTPAADFAIEVDTLRDRLTLPKLRMMNGLGALSDEEGRRIQRAATPLNARMSEARFKAVLKQIEAEINTALARHGGAGGGGVPELEWDPTTNSFKAPTTKKGG